MEIKLLFLDDLGFLYWRSSVGKLVPLTCADGCVRVPAAASLYAVVRGREGLAALAPVAGQVHGLELRKTLASDEDLAPLAALTALRSLDLCKSKRIGDAGVALLRGLLGLEELDLYWTRLTDAGLIHLTGLTRLRRLHLGMTRIRGRGLERLNTLTSLESLSLEDTRVDDGALRRLDLPQLRELVLAGTWVTPSGARAFMDRLPGCVLHGEFRTNARRFEAARRTRDALTLLIRRVVPRHPVTLDSSEEELVEVLDRLFPKGTGFSALRLPGDQPIASVMAPPWHDELAHAYPLVRLLLAMPRNAFLRITLPGGSTFTVSWIAERGRERRRPAQRLGN